MRFAMGRLKPYMSIEFYGIRYTEKKLCSYLFAYIKGINLYYKADYWIRTLNTAVENFHVLFLNNNFAVDIASISVKLLGNVFYNTLPNKLFRNTIFSLLFTFCDIRMQP